MRYRPGDLVRLSWDSKAFRKRFRRSLQPKEPFRRRRGGHLGAGAHTDRAEHAARYADVYDRLDRQIIDPPDLPWGDGPADIRWRRIAGRWQRWSQLGQDWADDPNPPGALVEHLRAEGTDSDGTWCLVEGAWETS